MYFKASTAFRSREQAEEGTHILSNRMIKGLTESTTGIVSLLNDFGNHPTVNAG
jgi:hypothetical protein